VFGAGKKRQDQFKLAATLLPKDSPMNCLCPEKSLQTSCSRRSPGRSRVLQLAQTRLSDSISRSSRALPLGEFDQFQNILHLIERLFQRFDDLRHFAYRLLMAESSGLRRAAWEAVEIFASAARVVPEFKRADRWRNLRRQ